MKKKHYCKIGAFTYEIIYATPEQWEREGLVGLASGKTDFHKQKIWIQNDLTEEAQRTILIHEILHVAFYHVRSKFVYNENFLIPFTHILVSALEDAWLLRELPK
jgi:hypothetical protein